MARKYKGFGRMDFCNDLMYLYFVQYLSHKENINYDTYNTN